MFQDIDNMEASSVLNIKVGMFTHLEQSKTSYMTVKKTEIVGLTIQHNLIVSDSFKSYLGENLSQASADVFGFEQCPMYCWHSYNFGCCTLQSIPVSKQATSD